MQNMPTPIVPISTANARTPAKWRTRDWLLSNAAWATSEHTQMSIQKGAAWATGQQEISVRMCSRQAVAWASRRTFLIDAFAQEVEEVGIRTPGARTRAVQVWAARAEARAALESSICLMLTYVRVPASHANRSRTLHYGESEDPAKMAISRLALTERGPSFPNPAAKSRMDPSNQAAGGGERASIGICVSGC